MKKILMIFAAVFLAFPLVAKQYVIHESVHNTPVQLVAEQVQKLIDEEYIIVDVEITDRGYLIVYKDNLKEEASSKWKSASNILFGE